MRDRKDDDSFCESLKYDVVREVANGQLANVGIVNSKDRAAGERERLN
jgi:hypothetical protein